MIEQLHGNPSMQRQYYDSLLYDVEVLHRYEKNTQLAIKTLGTLLKCFIKVKIEGQENIPKEGGVVLAGLKLDIWEREGVTLRSSLSSDHREQFIREFEERIFPYDTLESVERTRYRSEMPSPEEVFSHLESLEVKKENAFLWRGKIEKSM